ncbi:MAG: tetratricopeptide repeat protein [Dehalococcoidia bacterium]|nr:tetratricopeptide repeat protein [Dehalococcoidia bacterium]
MQGRWEEAVVANRSIIEVFPNDVNAYNRLGKALTELGHYAEAGAAYGRALEVDPRNSIALRNLRRLSVLNEVPEVPGPGCQRVIPQLLIEETGKAGVVSLEKMAPGEVLAKLAAGEPVYLRPKGQGLIVESKHGEYLGKVQPRIGLRLAKLIDMGTRYSAAIASSADSEVKVIITEVFQHPSQAGRPSFPAKSSDGFRSYVKESILKYELGEKEGALDESGYPIESEEEAEALPEGMSLIVENEDGNVPDEES